MKEWERTKFIRFLKENVLLFAWAPFKMLRIDQSFIRHKLNIMLEAWLVKHKGKRSIVEHVDTVIEEVDKLNKADAIREGLYPSWISNKKV